MNFDLSKLSPGARKRNSHLFEGKDAVKKTKAPNVNETRCYDEYLTVLLKRGIYDKIVFEARKFKIYTLKYTSDWYCYKNNVLVACYEVKPFYKNKGKVHFHAGSRERLKLAAALYPNTEFYATWVQEGEWLTERIMPTKGEDDELL